MYERRIRTAGMFVGVGAARIRDLFAAVAKVSILARGHSGGFTWCLPQGETVLATRSRLGDRLVALLGGRAAEEVILRPVPVSQLVSACSS